jgi:hypothetical protein
MSGDQTCASFSLMVMRARLQTLVLLLCIVGMIAGCIPIPILPTSEVHETENDIDDLLDNNASRSDVIKSLGSPNRQYESVISYKVCRNTSGVAFILCVPLACTGGELNSPETECFELILKFDGNDYLTGYKKAPFEGEYQTPDGIKLGIIRLMAEQGFPESQWRLYDESGRQPEDIIWLCRSADNGIAKAQLHVGRLYWDASYIHQNKIKAYVWYKLAATGDKLGDLSPDKGTQNIAWPIVYNTEKILTAEQLKAARVLYKKWQSGQCEQDLAPKAPGN